VEKKLEFHIENVGGCRRLDVTLYPGVVVLKAPNGAGKSSAIRAISRAAGADVALEPRDGSPGGIVQGPGVSLRIRKNVGATGSPDAAAADVGPLADLIDPGLKDPEAAARARLRALLRMVPLPTGIATLRELAAGDQQIEHAVTNGDRDLSTVLEVAEAVRRAAQELAREAEASAARAGGEEAALQAAIAAKGVTPEEAAGPGYTPEEARGVQQDAARELDVAREGAKRRREAEARLQEARAAVGERPDEVAARTAVEAADVALAVARDDVSELRKDLAAAEAKAAAKATALSGARESLATTEAALRQWQAQQEILLRPIDGPTDADVDAAEELYNEVAGELALAEKRAEVRTLAAAQAHAADAAAAATARAARLREAAKGVSGRLATLLSRSGLQGMAVVDGRLVVDVGGEQRDFADRLSDGEKVAAALRVAAVAYPGRVVPLDGRFWTALDQRRQVAFAAEAERQGLFCVTEQPDDCEGIQAEHVGFVQERAAAVVGGAT